ncbi:MAG: IclR family transcriptional regulator domain-containing protein [Janthinobacterium lividum]
MAEAEFVQSLARGLAVLTVFDAEHRRLSSSDVAAATGLSRATARRLLHTLVELGYMRTDGRLFAPTPQVLRLGTSYLSGLGLPELAQPHLERLSAEVGESTSMAVLDGTDIVYVARVTTRRIMTVDITVGTRFPAFATSMGRVLLAGLADTELDAYFTRAVLTPPTPTTTHAEPELRRILDQVRDQGWALNAEELEPGLHSVAAPVHGAARTVVAAVNVSTAVAGRPAQVRGPLLVTARAISVDVTHDLDTDARVPPPSRRP